MAVRLAVLSVYLLVVSCARPQQTEFCAALPDQLLVELRRYSVLSEGVVVDPAIPRSSRQSYFLKDSISFGNYYNQLLIYSYKDFSTSTDTIFDALNEAERDEMVQLAEQFFLQQVMYAEYNYGWECNVFRLPRPDDPTRTMFLALADTSNAFISPAHIQLLCAGPGFFCCNQSPYR